MGKTANPQILDTIKTILEIQQEVKNFQFPKTIHLGPESILAVIELEFIESIEFVSAKGTLHDIRQEIKEQCPGVNYIFFQSMEKKRGKE